MLTFIVNSSNDGLRGLAVNGIKKLKTLRHPSILKFLSENVSSAKISFSAEWGTPVGILGSELPSPDYILWGMLKILLALGFLHTECGISHGNVGEHAVYITMSGEWKLGDCEWAYRIGESIRVDAAVSMSTLRPLNSLHPPEGYMDAWDLRSESHPIHAYDVWCFGAMAKELLRRASTQIATYKRYQRTFDKFTGLLQSSFMDSNPLKRSTTSAFVAQNLAPRGCFDTKFIRLMDNLESISVRSPEERESDFRELRKEMKNFPAQLKKHKILPLLSNALEYPSSSNDLAESLLDAAQDCSVSDFNLYMKPVIRKLINSNDVSVRSAAIEKLHLIYPKSDKTPYSAEVLALLKLYLKDPSPYIRDRAIRSSTNYTEHLNTNDYNSMLTSLYELLRDSEPGIRVNSIICFAKISKLHQSCSNKEVVMAALTNSLSDPNGEVRVAAVSSIATTAQLYSPKDLIAVVIPKILPCALDQESSVRSSAISTIQTLIGRLIAIGESINHGGNDIPSQNTHPALHSIASLSAITTLNNTPKIPSIRTAISSEAVRSSGRTNIPPLNALPARPFRIDSPSPTKKSPLTTSPSTSACDDGWDSFLF